MASGWTISSCVQRPLYSGWTILHPLSNDHWKQKCRFRKLCCLIASLAINRDGAYLITMCNKIDDLRARSTTCEQDRCVCVCVILHISSWRYGRIVTLFWCISDDYNLCVCVTTPPEIIPYYRLNHSICSLSDNKEVSRWVLRVNAR
jgi:hypothetical protein